MARDRLSFHVADSAPIVRPWKPRIAATIPIRPVLETRELDRRFDRLGARVAQERARHPGRRDRRQRGQQLGAAVVVEDLRAGDELRRPAA